jgi:hypothetical protein
MAHVQRRDTLAAPGLIGYESMTDEAASAGDGNGCQTCCFALGMLTFRFHFRLHSAA